LKEHIELWDEFCESQNIIENSVVLFKHTNFIIDIKRVGLQSKRFILSRSAMMEEFVEAETDKLVIDWQENKHNLDGLIYMMFTKENDKVIPLYIGKTETIGKGDGNLSVNIKNLHSDKSKFARWGDGYSYHIGDLSAVALHGHDEKKRNKKYMDWADALFVDFPSKTPKLKKEVYFWTMAWNKNIQGIWKEFGQTRLTFLEYLMIGVASSAFPELLNREG
jgi:hypothetical protein